MVTTSCHPSGGSIILSDHTPESAPPELAPFLAQAKARLEEATEGLQPHEAIQHLETTLARTEIEASRLGIQFDVADAIQAQLATTSDEDGPVVVIRRMPDPGEGET